MLILQTCLMSGKKNEIHNLMNYFNIKYQIGINVITVRVDFLNCPHENLLQICLNFKKF